MKLYEATGIGVVMGCLYGLVLWASVDALSLASFILYKDTRVLPEMVTAIIIILAFGCLFTYTLWEPILEQMIITTVKNEKEKEDDDE
jgi:hypothetical protein